MGNKTRAPDIQKPFIHAGGNGFFRVYRSLFESEPFRKLPSSAQILYIGMGIASKGDTQFKFPHSAYSKLMSKETFRRAKAALIEAGFIEAETEWRNGEPNVYRLSGKWKLKDPKKLK